MAIGARHRAPSGPTSYPAHLKATSSIDFGATIRSRRKELGYTQEELAEMLGWSPRLIGDIERGKATVGIQRVLDLALGLGIDVSLDVRGH